MDIRILLKEPIRFIRHLFNVVRFRLIHSSTVIRKPIIFTPRYIECGKRVYIGYNARIEAIRKYNEKIFTPKIVFEDGVSIQQNMHLTCANSIYIERNVAIAANVTITDIHHPYDDINIPIEQQDIFVDSVLIKKNSKIYNNVVILPGVTIGQHVTIGANSVVTNDIPDFSVAVGIPARIVKRYCFDTKTWRKTNSKGEFID